MPIMGTCKVCGGETSDYECTCCMRYRIDELEAIITAQRDLLALYNNEDTCHVEFDSEESLGAFASAQDALEAVNASKPSSDAPTAPGAAP